MKKPNDIKRPNSNSGSMGQFLRSREHMTHNACNAWMAPHPFDPMGPRIPHVERPGRTLNLGRNKAKRNARQLRKSMDVAVRETSQALRGEIPLAA